MSRNEKIKIFEDQPIRTTWNAAEEKCFFHRSIVDIICALTDSKDPLAC